MNMNPNFIMGVYTKNNTKNNNKKNNHNNVLIEQLLKIQNQIKSENTNTNVVTMENIKVNQPNEKKTFKNILIHVIQKLEDDIDKVSQKINEYNKEKKDIMEMNQREIIRLKKLTKKLYYVIKNIYNSMELNKNQKIKLLEKLRKNIESNKIFLQNIQSINDIKSYANSHIEESNKNMNIQKTNTNNINFNQVNKNINKLNQNIKMNVVENTLNQPVNNSTTIYNLIEENQKETQSNNSNKNKNKNQNKGFMNQVINTIDVIQNDLSKPANLGNQANKVINTITAPFIQSNQVQEPQIVEPSENESQNLSPKEKKKKVNMSDKISKMLNQVQPINKSRANSLLNDYLREKTGTSNLKKLNSNSNKKNNQSINTSINSSSNSGSFNTVISNTESSNTIISNTGSVNTIVSNTGSVNTTPTSTNQNLNKKNNIFI